ncbi:ubiquitin-associated domain-containing protein 2-like isoform X1 [Asterias rubens]|uniref:ubiquitin-associated domain-containing protein 2-like isoform X1 n=2 Tax=Asterias rubens TaxID=7604 RepID=UPI0014559EBB|nr:ubiquitin-associated domain-containing protein 2-like isoform X1 [Asterias rubens]
MWSQYSNFGFYKTPVSKGFLSCVGCLSVLLFILGPSYQQFFAYTTESLMEKLEIWRLVTSKMVFLDTRNLLLGLLLMYNFRVFEKRYGSTKFASYLLANGVLTTCLEVAALFAVQNYQQGSIPIHWTPGPTGVVVSMFVPFFFDLPYLTVQNIASHVLSGKWFVYIVGLQILAQSTQSILVVGCGLLSGLLYRSNFLRLQSWLRIPNPLSRLAATVLGPILRSKPPGDVTLPMGATLELQRQQRMDLIEQQMMFAQARQYRQQARQRGEAFRQRPTISAPLAARSSGSLASMFRQRRNPASNTGDTPDTLPGTAPSNGQASPNQPSTSRDTNSIPEEHVQQLTDMGFNRGAVVQALLATHNNVSMATNLLLQDG